MPAVRQEVRVPTLPEPISHYTDAVRVGNLLFVSGCIGVGPDGQVVSDDVVEQTRQLFENMGQILNAGGTSFSEVLKVTVFLTDVDDRVKINPVRREFFGDARPASTLVQVSRLARPQAKVEVESVAFVPDADG